MLGFLAATVAIHSDNRVDYTFKRHMFGKYDKIGIERTPHENKKGA
jgi:hypothetical protein